MPRLTLAVLNETLLAVGGGFPEYKLFEGG